MSVSGKDNGGHGVTGVSKTQYSMESATPSENVRAIFATVSGSHGTLQYRFFVALWSHPFSCMPRLVHFRFQDCASRFGRRHFLYVSRVGLILILGATLKKREPRSRWCFRKACQLGSSASKGFRPLGLWVETYGGALPIRPVTTELLMVEVAEVLSDPRYRSTAQRARDSAAALADPVQGVPRGGWIVTRAWTTPSSPS